jgi:hypothetical protein
MRRFGDPDEPDRPPEDLTSWLAAGMRRVEAMSWRRWNFTLDAATRWRSAGVFEALGAAQWQAAGVNPDTVGGWLDAEIGASEAIRWHEFGFDLSAAQEHTKNGHTAEEAYGQQQTLAAVTGSFGHRTSTARMLPDARIHKFLQSGAPHELVRGYLELQWVDDEAIAWAHQGIQAGDARTWQGIGLTAAEAGELSTKDIKPLAVIQEWWRAGIPFDEVAEWLGAGLTSEEAVTQKANGVTVEQAAALRALRRGGAL